MNARDRRARPRVPGVPADASAQLLAARYGHLELFAGVDFEDIASLVASCPLVEVDPGQTVLREGASNRTIYQIVSGRVRVALTGFDGMPLFTLEDGACFGELSILSRFEVSANVVALERTQLLAMPDETLWGLVRGSHRFSVNMLDVLSGRLRLTNERLRDSLQAQARYARAARLDPLTGLNNRRWLDEVLVREFRRCVAGDLPLSLMMIDIDLFKQVNDGFGHLVGDEVLRIVASRLRSAVGSRGFAARFGGEEFAVLLAGTPPEAAHELAEGFRAALISNPVSTSNGPLAVTVSTGIADRVGCASPRCLVERADTALYAAKSGGRNRVFVAAERTAASVARKRRRHAEQHEQRP